MTQEEINKKAWEYRLKIKRQISLLQKYTKDKNQLGIVNCQAELKKLENQYSIFQKSFKETFNFSNVWSELNEE